MSKLGIIAGRGDLLKGILDTCVSQGRPYFVISFPGQASPELIEEHPHEWVDLAKAGRIVEVFRQQGVTDIVMAGWFIRPSLSQLRPDFKGAKLLAKIVGRPLGDDGLFRILVSFLEQEGFNVVSSESILGKECLCPLGVLTATAPDDQAQMDIERGLEVASALGQVDVGQSVVVQQGIVLGVEAIEGTDKLLQRVTDLKLEGPGGILIKIIKPGQETRVDRAVIGAQTIQECYRAGLRGVAVQAEGVILLGKDETIRLANELNFFVVGVKFEQTSQKGQTRSSKQ